MAKFRVRSKGAKKGFRWSKGQSSSSNPSKTRHRDAAKARQLRAADATLAGSQDNRANPFQSTGASRLTEESLLKHDAFLGTPAVEGAAEAEAEAGQETLTLSQTHKTFDTWASDWSSCTHISFAQLLKKFNPQNAQHKEMLAILEAVTEVIKEKGGQETSTEYFSACLTTLEVADTAEGLAAVLSLISMIIKSVPREILQKEFGRISKVLLELLSKFGGESSTPASTTRALLGCLSVLLRAQSAFTWRQTSTMQVYRALLTFVAHAKPKVRKAAQHAVCAVLKGSFVMLGDDEADDGEAMAVTPPDFHPAVDATRDYFLQLQLELAEETNTILYALTLLKEIIADLPKSAVKSLCDVVLSVMQTRRSQPFVTACAMRVLYGLFSARPASRTLPASLNAQILNALYDYRPSLNDAQPMRAWLTVQQEGLINLVLQDRWLCLDHVMKFFSEAKRCWTSDQASVAEAATTALKAVTTECIKPNVEEFMGKKESQEKLKKTFAHVQEGLGYQYHVAWAQVLHLLSVVFDIAGAHCHPFLAQCLPVLADRRNADNFALKNELDFVMGRAVRSMGPDVVLQHVDLQITGQETNYDFPRSWLLPVLIGNVQHTRLAFFAEYFLPLSERCLARSVDCLAKNDKIGHKLYQVLESQIWSLLPGFCNAPTDLKSSFKPMAKGLAMTMKKRKDLRIDIMSSLRQLIMKNMDHEENRAILSNYAGKYIAILCDIYIDEPKSTAEKGQRLAAFETIKQFLKLTPAQLRHEMFDKAFLVYVENTGFVKESTLDILRAQLPYQDETRIRKLYETAVQQLGSKDHKEQKKAYKILDDLCSSESESCITFLRSQLASLQQIFLASLSKASPSSQAARLHCLLQIIRHLDAEHVDFAYKILPEVVLCVKAVNEKARSSAYTLLLAVGETLLRCQKDIDGSGESDDGDNDQMDESSNDKVLKSYMAALLAGLAGPPNLVQCTLLAITRVFHEFKDLFPASVIDMLIHDVCLLITSQSREVVSSCLSFVKAFVIIYPVLKTGKHVQAIVKALINMSEDCKRHFRLKTRYLLDRLVRKFGFDLISGLVPKDDVTMHKRLKNIKKLQAQKKKLDEQKERNAESDDEDGESFRIRAKPKTMDEILDDADSENELDSDMETAPAAATKTLRKKKKKQETYITEQSGEGIVDLLDPSAAQQVTSVKPKTSAEREAMLKARKEKSRTGGFEIGSDGRLIIKDSDEEDDEDESGPMLSGKNPAYFMEDSDDAEEEEKNSFKAMLETRKRKAGTSIASSRKSRATTVMASESSMKYRAGGSGIHRPLQKNGSTKDFGAEYRAKKARGDVKKKDQPDPYAYMPLDKSSLNRRKQAKYQGQFKNIVKGAQQGAMKGKSKAKAKAQLIDKIKKMKV